MLGGDEFDLNFVRRRHSATKGNPMPEAYIIDASRRPRGIGKVGKGALAHIHPQQLSATVLGAKLNGKSGVLPQAV